MGRRAQNEGSVYQRRSDGRWVAALSLGEGRRRHFYGKTEKEALERRDEAKADLKEGRTPPPSRYKVARLADEWLESLSHTVRPRTIESYRGLLKKHLLPELGQENLAKLQPSDLERAYNKRVAAGVHPKTVRNAAGVMHSLLERAARHGLVSRNVARLATPPRVPRREMTVLSPDEALRLLRAAQGHRMEAFFVLALTTGARLGELAGMQWDRIDFKTRTMRITHTLQEKGDEFQLVEPKTAQSVREVALPQMAVDSLLRRRADQDREALALGSAWSNRMNLVFTDPAGNPLKRRRIRRQEFLPIAKEAGLPSTVRVHDLRHAAASLLLSHGTPIPLVAELLGHTDPSITLRVYSHAIPTSQRQVADTFERMFDPARMGVA